MLATRFASLSLAALLALPFAAAAQTPSAQDMLARADEYRNFRGQPFSFDLALTNIDNGEKTYQLKAKIQNAHRSLVIYQKPSSERGKALLMDGHNLWFSSPGTSKPLRITPQQRLLGEASNGDVASTDFSGDYTATLLGAEVSDDAPTQKLELTAKPGTMAAYSRLHLWIDAADFRPRKAEFFGPSGKLLKRAYYRRYEKLANLGDKPQLVELEIINALNDNKRTVMRYANFNVAPIPDAQFSVGYLSSLR